MADEVVGEVVPGTWSFKQTATLRDTAVVFTVRGFLRPLGILTDPISQAQIGEIIFNFWHTKATVTLRSGKTYLWQYTNLWNTYWELTGGDNTRILYHGFNNRGEIEIHHGDHLLALIGLVIPRYFKHSNSH